MNSHPRPPFPFSSDASLYSNDFHIFLALISPRFLNKFLSFFSYHILYFILEIMLSRGSTNEGLYFIFVKTAPKPQAIVVTLSTQVTLACFSGIEGYSTR